MDDWDVTDNGQDLMATISELFRSQTLAVLATEGDGQPYASLMAFAATKDLKSIIFVTSRSTRKFSNLTGNPKAAFLVDSRIGSLHDFREAMAVTVTGLAREVEEEDMGRLSEIYIAKYPQLRNFISSPNHALMRLDVSKYTFVGSFPRVLEMENDS
jgi:nitroimidazol reductase NimA-like FMN-containing flavoprotein (pyridoxamine 5'-phosphate oxidase superfamily)